MLMVSAIVSGPAHSIAQWWLAGQLRSPLTSFGDELAEAACAALRGTRVPAQSARLAPARRGRVTVELLSEDGGVAARAQATADLVPVEPERFEGA